MDLPGYSKLLEIQQAYAPYMDSAGRPLSAIPTVVAQQSSNILLPFANNQQQQQPQPVYINRNCEFDSVFYDSVNESGVLKEKPSFMSQRRWERICDADNPDPERYGPVIILGVEALKQRFETQNKESKKLQTFVDETLSNTIEGLERSCEIHLERLKASKAAQSKLYYRLLDVLRKIEVLRCHGVELTNNEVKYEEKLRSVFSTLTNYHQRLIDIMNIEKSVLQSKQQQMQQLSQHSALLPPSTTTALNVSNSRHMNGDNHNNNANQIHLLNNLQQTLRQQKEHLQKLSEVIRKDSRDVKIMHNIMNHGQQHYQQHHSSNSGSSDVLERSIS